MRYRPYQKPCPQASAPSLAQIHPEVCEHLHPDLMGPQTYAYHNQIHPNGSGSASLSGMPPQASTPVYPDLVHPKFHERSLVPTGWNVEDSQTSRSDFEELPTDVVPLPPPPPAQAAVVDVPSCSVLPMTPRMFDCHITVVVYCSKKNKQKQDVWKSIRTPKDCWITFDCRSIDYKSFHQLVADECSKTYTKMPKLVYKGTIACPPTISWTAHICRNKQWLMSSPKPMTKQGRICCVDPSNHGFQRQKRWDCCQDEQPRRQDRSGSK